MEARRDLLVGGAAGYGHALANFERACAGTRDDASPHAGLVEACIGLMEHDCSSDRDGLASRARAELKHAVALDPAAPDVMHARGEATYRLDWALPDAEQQLRAVLSLRPGNLRARLRLAECLVSLGRPPEAAAMALDVAARLPGWTSMLLRAGRVLHVARAYDDALRVLASAVAADPDSAVARLDLALTYAAIGDLDRACGECDNALAYAAGRGLFAAALANAARSRGDASIHEAARGFVTALDVDAPFASCCVGLLDAAFGNTHRPLEYWDPYDESVGLAKFVGLAAVPGSLSMFVPAVGLIAYFGVNPWFDGIRRAPAVQALLGRLGSHGG
jgi:Tfp pilus assembly protein PilF